MIRILCAFVTLMMITAALRRALAQEADEYAVWAAAIDALFGADPPPSFILSDSTRGEVAMSREDEASRAGVLRSAGLDSAMVADYLARNHRAAPVDPRRISMARVRFGPAAPGEPNQRRLAIELSRPGFDAGRTHAIVRVGALCGRWCGDGQTLLMERGRDGRWTVAQTVSIYSY